MGGNGGEGGIGFACLPGAISGLATSGSLRSARTLGSLLDYGALAKLCFRPLSHLTAVAKKITFLARRL